MSAVPASPRLSERRRTTFDSGPWSARTLLDIAFFVARTLSRLWRESSWPKGFMTS
jgi:hypothetical protein